jgi:hypothetical protein
MWYIVTNSKERKKAEYKIPYQNILNSLNSNKICYRKKMPLKTYVSIAFFLFCNNVVDFNLIFKLHQFVLIRF